MARYLITVPIEVPDGAPLPDRLRVRHVKERMLALVQEALEGGREFGTWEYASWVTAAELAHEDEYDAGELHEFKPNYTVGPATLSQES